MSSWFRELELAKRAAAAAARHLASGFGGFHAAKQDSGARDIKLAVDEEAEHIIRDVLAVSAFPVLGEEIGGIDPFGASDPVWVVDPLDGTFNYSRSSDLCCVSVGLWHEGVPVLGVIDAFARAEVFAGIVGEGAWLNGDAIRVSAVTCRKDAALMTGFPVYRDYGAESVHHFIRNVQAFKKIRMLGSAAISLAWVASGRADAYFEEDIMLWDVAAGLALVSAAEGHIDWAHASGLGVPTKLTVRAMASREIFTPATPR